MTALDIVKAFNELLWNHFLMYALLGVGIFYTVYLGFPQIRHLNLAFKYAFGSVFKKKNPGENKVSSFQALATAVAAQVGTGNIGGVATAIATGGMGAIFWMWLSALLGMSTIFSEAVLAQKYKKEYHGETVGGSAYYLYYGLGSKWLAVFFSIAIVFALGCVGNMVQANSISIALTNAFHISPYIVGFVLAAVVAVVIIGGQRRITSLAELLVPFMAVVYIIGSLVIIFIFADHLPYVFRTIFHDAFSMEAAGGGAAGTVMKYAIRYGVARGLFSNEAGTGSTPHGHGGCVRRHGAHLFVDRLCHHADRFFREYVFEVGRHYAGRLRDGVRRERHHIPGRQPAVLRLHDHHRLVYVRRDEHQVHVRQEGGEAFPRGRRRLHLRRLSLCG